MTNIGKILPIHIGMHKTGSTFLQHVVFPRMIPEWAEKNSGREWNLLISEITKTESAKNPEGAKQLIQAKNSGGDQPSIFISSESLSGRQKCNCPGESIERFNGFMDGLILIGASRKVKVVIFFAHICHIFNQHTFTSIASEAVGLGANFIRALEI